MNQETSGKRKKVDIHCMMKQAQVQLLPTWKRLSYLMQAIKGKRFYIIIIYTEIRP